MIFPWYSHDILMIFRDATVRSLRLRGGPALTAMVSVPSVPSVTSHGTLEASFWKVMKRVASGNLLQFATLWWTNIAIENGHRNSGFSH